MRRLPLVLLALALAALAAARAQNVGLTHWRSGLIELNEDWAAQDGDDASWAKTGFDDSGWKTVDIEDQGPARQGWRWFRKRVKVGPDYTDVRLLIEGGDGTYELYVNGELQPGASIHSPFDVSRPTERVFAIGNDAGEFTFALRTHAPPNYVQYHLPLFLSVTLGGPTAIGYEQEALKSQRLYAAVTTVVANVLLILAGLGALGLYLNQRSEREYLFLGLYLLLLGTSDGLWISQQAGVLPTSMNLLLADPLTYLIGIAQIEFTFSFARRRVGRVFRIYEALLLLGLPMAVLDFTGIIPSNIYVLLEGLVALPAALVLPFLLFRWYRRGNREAGWLILPSLLPAATSALYNLGTASIFFGWRGLDFLDAPIPLGPFALSTTDASSLLFLLAVGIVMFFRFTSVTREQTRVAAELEAAREIQQRLVPAKLPQVAGLEIEAAYFPALEVGGDFYQVIEQENGSALIVVGDVSGKGLKAAMTGALAIGALRTLAAESLRPGELMARLNRQMFETQEYGFITCCCVRIGAAGMVTVANAGHLAPYRNGEEMEVESSLPLGLAEDCRYAETSVQLERGDRLTLISDGVVEATDAEGNLFGFERTRVVSGQSAAAIAATAQRFGQEDDITVLTVARTV
jgi:sigma-B regulation protein RsbU (phosphoserine phosphatase)